MMNTLLGDRKRNLGEWFELIGFICVFPGIVIFTMKALIISGLISLSFVIAAMVYYKKQGTLNAFWLRKAPIMAASLIFLVGLVVWNHFRNQ